MSANTNDKLKDSFERLLASERAKELVRQADRERNVQMEAERQEQKERNIRLATEGPLKMFGLRTPPA
jgi:hypothetical protein